MFTDKNYLDLLHNGNKQDFKFFHKKYYQYLCYYALRFIDNRQEAEDISQEALAKLWERRRNIQDIAFVKPFLLTIVKNSCLNYLKREKRKEDSIKRHPAPDMEYDDGTNNNNEERAEIMEMLKTSIAKLTPRKQEIFNLMMKGLPNKKIAAQLGIKAQTVRSQKHTIIQFMKEQVRLYLSGEE